MASLATQSKWTLAAAPLELAPAHHSKADGTAELVAMSTRLKRASRVKQSARAAEVAAAAQTPAVAQPERGSARAGERLHPQ